MTSRHESPKGGWGKHPNWSWKRELVWAVVFTLLLGGYLAVMEKAWPAEPQIHARQCVTDSGTPCSTQAKRQAKKFRDGKLGNSHDLRLPYKVRKKIKQWYANHPNAKVAAKDDADWWNFPFHTSICLTGHSSKFDCMTKGDSAEDLDSFRDDLKSTTKLAVKCSGGAVIGAIAGGGWWGAGKGAGACLWFALFTKTF